MGRPPTSGYCHTCRKRHVKCDRGLPSCTRCLRSGHTCQGYAMPLRIVNMPHTNPPPQASPSLSLFAFKEPVCLEYFLSTYTWAHWWKALVINGLRQPTASAGYMAVQSLLLGYFGSGNVAPALRTRSLRLYGASMRLVSQLLDARADMPFAELVLPVMVLGMYPYVMEKSVDLEHNVGLELVLRSCGPTLNHSGNGNTVDVHAFRSCRAMLICTALAKRQATFLDEPEWKTEPFLDVQKTSMDTLLDIISSLPGLVEDLFKTKENGHLQSESVLKLTARASFLLGALQRWRWEWERMNPRAAQLLTISTGQTLAMSTGTLYSSGSGFTLAQTVLQRDIRFQTLDLALEILGYNAALVYLFRIQELLVGSYEQGGGFLTPSLMLQPEDMHYINNQLLQKKCHSPLLLPHEVRFSIQPALEVVQQSAYIAAELKSNDLLHFVALAPVGIIYCALKSLGVFGEPLAKALVVRLSAQASVDQLEVFGLW